MKPKYLAVVCWTAAAAVAGSVAVSHADTKAVEPARMPVDQARRTVDMLNDLYVNSVVLTHNAYVKGRGTVASAVVARQVFKAMGEKGWPETRWINTAARSIRTPTRRTSLRRTPSSR